MNYFGHTVVNLSACAGLTYYGLFKTEFSEQPVVIFSLTFIFVTLFLSPDIDLSYSRTVKRWGVFSFLMKPYSLFFRHRGLSHQLILGSLSRIVYLIFVFSFLYFLVTVIFRYGEGSDFVFNATEDSKSKFKEIFIILVNTFKVNKNYFYAIAVGIGLSDAIHIGTDLLISKLK